MSRSGVLGLINIALGLILVGIVVASLFPGAPAVDSLPSGSTIAHVVTPAGQPGRPSRKAGRAPAPPRWSAWERAPSGGPQVLVADDGQPVKD